MPPWDWKNHSQKNTVGTRFCLKPFFSFFQYFPPKGKVKASSSYGHTTAVRRCFTGVLTGGRSEPFAVQTSAPWRQWANPCRITSGFPSVAFCVMQEVPFPSMQRMEVAVQSPLKLITLHGEVLGERTTGNGPEDGLPLSHMGMLSGSHEHKHSFGPKGCCKGATYSDTWFRKKPNESKSMWFSF